MMKMGLLALPVVWDLEAGGPSDCKVKIRLTTPSSTSTTSKILKTWILYAEVNIEIFMSSSKHTLSYNKTILFSSGKVIPQ